MVCRPSPVKMHGLLPTQLDCSAAVTYPLLGAAGGFRGRQSLSLATWGWNMVRALCQRQQLPMWGLMLSYI